MEQIIEFVTTHWILSLSLVTIIGLLIAGELPQRMGGIKEIGPVETTQLVNHQDAVLLDVREKSELKDGSLLNAVSVPVDKIVGSAKKLEAYRQRPIITYCNNGQQGRKACGLLRRQGFDAVYNLSGGLAAWRSANMPVQKQG